MPSISRFIQCVCLVAAGAASAGAASIDVVFYDNRFGALNDATGVFTQTGTLPVTGSAGIAWMNGLFYVEDLGSNLYAVDPSTSNATLVGSTGMATTSGAFAGGQAGLFEVDYSSNLYQLNAATGKASLIGSTGLAANNGNYDTSLAMNGSILYYTAGKAGAKDELYQISTTTGITTDLGSTGVTGIAGSAFVNGSLELFQYGQAANYIYTAAAGSISFAKGAQLNAQILDGGAFQSAPSSNALTAPSGVPEPTTFVLLGGGLALIGLRARRRKRGEVAEKTEIAGPARF